LEATPSDYSSCYFQQQQQIHSHSQPVAPIPNAEINHKALSEILEVLKNFKTKSMNLVLLSKHHSKNINKRRMLKKSKRKVPNC
jgi:hypothetical protein